MNISGPEQLANDEIVDAAEKFEAQQLVKKELGFDTDLALKIKQETDEHGELINADIVWTRFPTPEGTTYPPVEGKVYVPKNPNGRLIIFAPGSPGGDGGTFERKHAKVLVENGNTLITIRHNGQGIGVEKTQTVFNAPQRIEMMERSGQQYLGQGTAADKPKGYDWRDVTTEPLTPLLDTQGKFDDIVLIGHSMGGASMFRSVGILAESRPEVAQKIKKIVSLAGYLGKGEEASQRFWHGTKFPFEELVSAELEDARGDRVHYNQDREAFATSIKTLAQEMNGLEIPPHIAQVLVTSPYDAVIAMPVIKYQRQKDGKEFAWAYDYPGYTRRSLVIEDHTQPAKKTHKMLGVRPETLLRLVDMPISSYGPHFTQVREPLPKQERPKNQPEA